jgi:hypothetical protein
MPTLVEPAIELYELIAKNPSVFGRLIHIASLWNPETSRYERGLPERYRLVPGIDTTLAKWHQAFFLEWLSQSLTEKERDVTMFWNSASREQGKKIREIGQAAIPPLVRAEERQFFLQDLAFLQALL